MTIRSLVGNSSLLHLCVVHHPLQRGVVPIGDVGFLHYEEHAAKDYHILVIDAELILKGEVVHHRLLVIALQRHGRV